MEYCRRPPCLWGSQCAQRLPTGGPSRMPVTIYKSKLELRKKGEGIFKLILKDSQGV